MFSHPSIQVLLLVTLYLTTSLALHTKSSNTHSQTTSDQAQQLNYLINLQNNYASGVKAMTDETKNLKLKIQQTSNIDEKVKLLQTGITKQRQKMGELSSKLLPDPSADSSECTTIPADEVLKLNQQIFETKQNIQQFQSLLQISVPEIRTSESNAQIQKMKDKLNKIQKVLSRQCQQNVLKSAAVYQTNLYQNNNWILGTYTMQQLIDQFYRRSLNNHNITNCPLDRPFLKSFDTYNSDSLCVKCPMETPYFDMSVKNCVACPAGKQMNVTLRNCAIVPKNSLYSDTGRYRIQPLDSIPAPDPKLEYCPSNNPYFNGTDCVSCPGDTFWQISLSKCYACPAYSFFSLSSRQCELYPSIYVNGSRDRLLATDKTSIADYDKMLKDSLAKNPKYRPVNCTGNTSYAAVNSCIQCNPNNLQYFNVQTLTCSYCDGYPDQVTNKCKPKIYYYPNYQAPNLLFNATDYKTSKAKADADYMSNQNSTSYCPQNTPYPKKTRLQCMNCTQDAPLYLVQQYTCTKCPEPLGYDPVSRTCKPVLFLTDIYNNVVITPPSTLQDYVQAEANLNKTNLTKRCPVDKPNTVDAVNCFGCPVETPYFNLSSKFCVNCSPDSQYSTEKKGCFKVNYLTDLNASRLLEVDNYTVANVSKQQESLKSDPSKPLYALCPSNTPYGTIYGCVNCTDNTYFNLKSKTCEPCPQYFTYWPSTRKCVQQQNITNLSAGKKIVQTSNSTLANYTSQIENVKKSGPFLYCPPQKPYVVNGLCVACVDPNSYFLLSIRNCGPCDNFQPDLQTCPPKPYRYSNLSNHRWLTNDGNPDRIIEMTFQQKKNATGPKCPAFYNQKTRDCVNCQQNYYYNFDTGECDRCTNNTVFDLNIHKCSIVEPVGAYYTNIGSAQNSELIYGGLTFDQLNKTQTRDRLKYPNSAFCPTDKPYYDDISCVKCPNYKKYFNLRYNLCQVCLTNQVLSNHNCMTGSTEIWQQPIPEHVYPFLFSSL